MTTKHTPGKLMARGQYVQALPSKVQVAWCGANTSMSLDHGSHTITELEACANAARLALCWNTHDALAFHLLAASNYIDTLGGDSQKYRAALALVEGA